MQRVLACMLRNKVAEQGLRRTKDDACLQHLSITPKHTPKHHIILPSYLPTLRSATTGFNQAPSQTFLNRPTV